MRRQHGHRTAHVATNDGVAQRSMLVGRVTLADDGTVLTARYVIGCDGARSSTRSAIGTAMLAARAAAVGETAPNGGAPMPPLSGPLVGASGGVLAAQPMVGGAHLDDVIGPSWFVLARHDGDLDDTAVWWSERGAVVWSCDAHPEAAARRVGECARTSEPVTPSDELP